MNIKLIHSQTHVLITQFTGETSHKLDLRAVRMASLNQVLDPWLYVIFRKASIQRFIRKLKHCFFPDMYCTSPLHPRNQPRARYVARNKCITCVNSNATKVINNGLNRTRRRWSSPTRGISNPSNDRNDHAIIIPGVLPAESSYESADSSSLLIQICPLCDQTEAQTVYALDTLSPLAIGCSPTSSPTRPRNSFKEYVYSRNAHSEMVKSEDPDIETNLHECITKSYPRLTNRDSRQTRSRSTIKLFKPSLINLSSSSIRKLFSFKKSKKPVHMLQRRMTDQTFLSSDMTVNHQSLEVKDKTLTNNK